MISFSDWLEQNLGGKFPPDTLAGMRQDDLQKFVQEAVDERFQPELRHLERFVLLEHLDSAWKDHLLAMDHCSRASTCGYAKSIQGGIQTRRHAAVEAMWKSIGDRTVDISSISAIRSGDLTPHSASAGCQAGRAPTSEIAQRQNQAIAASGGGSAAWNRFATATNTSAA